MHILLANNRRLPIQLDDSPTANIIKLAYKHLQHVDIPFRDRDNPFYIVESPYSYLVERLVYYGGVVGVTVDREPCLSRDQSYFNQLHQFYENGYDGDPRWLDFHEHIHICENKGRGEPRYLSIDYREKAGPLSKSVSAEMLLNRVTEIQAGDVFVTFNELGKSPFLYWQNGEPNDIDRLCALAKPWLMMKPKIKIATEDIDFMARADVDGFNNWWHQHRDRWLQHWNLEHWEAHDMLAVSKIGRCPDIDVLISSLKDRVYPSRIVMS